MAMNAGFAKFLASKKAGKTSKKVATKKIVGSGHAILNMRPKVGAKMIKKMGLK